MVHDGDVELRLVCHFDARGLQATLPFALVLGAATDPASYQLGPRRRGQEDEERLGPVVLDLPRTLEVDLQQGGPPSCQGLLARAPRGAVARGLVDLPAPPNPLGPA